MITLSYSPQDWYWQVAGVGIYGSARRGLVSDPVNDAAYLAFKAASGPGAIAVDTASLDDVLVAAGQPTSGLVPATKAELLGYANAKIGPLLAEPQQYALPGGPTVTNDAGGQTSSDLTGLLVGPAAMGSSDTTQWTDNIGVVSVLTQPQVSQLAIAITVRAKAIYAAMATAASGLDSGSITTTAQVDAVGWPN